MAIQTKTIHTITCDKCSKEIKRNAAALTVSISLNFDGSINTAQVCIASIGNSNGYFQRNPDLCAECTKKILEKYIECLKSEN